MRRLHGNAALADVLASYVPKIIQNRIAANPKPIESPDTEDFQASVLFADISGFTLLTEHLAEQGPTGVETLARILNEYFTPDSFLARSPDFNENRATGTHSP